MKGKKEDSRFHSLLGFILSFKGIHFLVSSRHYIIRIWQNMHLQIEARELT